VALDTSFKSYKLTTEGASTNVVARMVIHRTMTMIRTGAEFGPYPIDPLDSSQNPLTSEFVEFQVAEDEAADTSRVVRIERRDQSDPERGPYELWYIQSDLENGVVVSTESRPLLTGLQDARFTLEYDVGPRLRRCTVDMTVRPNRFQDAKFFADLETPTIRLVSSVAPRRLEEE
jgi:hypothetical protein